MCGRIVQKEWPMDYVETIRWNPHTVFSPADIADGLRYNIPPGTRPLALHRLDDGAEHLDRIFWGYKPEWFDRTPVSNARLDKVLTDSRFWKTLLTRRVIVPADGWYEWTGEKPNKEPWFIHASDGDPILFAGISAYMPGAIDAEHGMAIVTDDAAGGLVDIHDRRPIALTVDDAWEWLDPETTPEQAKEILMTPRPESAFEWYRVTKAVGNSKYQNEDAIKPL